MELLRFSNQMDAYLQWRKQIHHELGRYRGWLIDHNLRNPELDGKLERAMDRLKNDKMTIAFVGEYSRGKTELINALLLSHFGTRILPSGIGRTTMCPTELFYDPMEPRNYIRLLPIETRKLDTSLAKLRNQPEQWHSIPINPNDARQVKTLIAMVADCKPVSRPEAEAMGFQTELLETEEGSDQVMVPAWRHALISIEQPLLAQGLVILDTPGLNALGCEPELTLSLLPNAHCILLMLSAAAGVTATDLDLWDSHIRHLCGQKNRGVYGILNKTDAVWDELESPDYNHQALEKIRHNSAKQLGVDSDKVLCISAREGLLAQIDGDLQRLNSSQLPNLEDLIATDIMRCKEQLIRDNVVTEIYAMLHTSRKTLVQRRYQLTAELKRLNDLAEDHRGQLEDQLEEARHQQRYYQKKLSTLNNSKTMLKQDGETLTQQISKTKLKQYLSATDQALISSWTLVGMNTAIDNLFSKMTEDLKQIQARLPKIEALIATIYAEYEAEAGLAPLHRTAFSVDDFFAQLDQLHKKTGSLGTRIRKLLTEQKGTSQRFLSAVVSEACSIYRAACDRLAEWLDTVLLPLFLITQEKQQLLDSNLKELEALGGADGNIDAHIKQLEEAQEDLNEQIIDLDQMIKAIRTPLPRTGNRPSVSA